METVLGKAKKLEMEIITNRRTLHQNAEIGFDLPKTTAFVKRKLIEYGYEPKTLGKSGILCEVGNGNKTILLRADMDALPMCEATGLSFECTDGNAHSCGHDAHTAMLLGAAKLLKENESKLKGRVKLMFQPAEEILAGANAMIEDGVLDNPKVDAAMALHITAGIEESSTGVIYYKESSLTFSGDAIQITVTGKDAHGSTPYLGVDAINIAAHIIIVLNSIIPKEIAISEEAVVLVGKIAGGSTVNTVAGTAVLDVSVRAKTKEMRNFLKKRVQELSEQTALLWGGTAKVDFVYGMPPLINDVTLCRELASYCKELLGEKNVQPMTSFNGTEDFCMVAEKVPAVLFTIGVGGLEEGYTHALHHPSLTVNEEALPVGAAVYAQCAMRWLEENP